MVVLNYFIKGSFILKFRKIFIVSSLLILLCVLSGCEFIDGFKEGSNQNDTVVEENNNDK